MLDGCRGLTGVDDGRRQETDSPVAVLVVMPAEEAATEVEAVLEVGEGVWEVRAVLEGFELAL